MGDDTGLDFQLDREAVQSLSRIADVQFVGWQPGQTPDGVKAQISGAIADPTGWDVLFFAGHSNETQLTGGELAVAPHATITIQEIVPQLTLARQRGLQFALFNSCNGLDIAAALIDLGFSQVAVMREPIHNRVAQDFLVQFLQALAAHRDVHRAMLAASQWLKTEKNLTYPSAYLVPSLFCHPGATLFQITPTGWRQRLQQLQPKRYEAIALATCLLLGLLPPVQTQLLERRIWPQAIYRDRTGQLPAVDPAPVFLVQIDEPSVDRSGMPRPTPIDRGYLAQLIQQLTDQNATIIGIDYLLDRQQPERDGLLEAAVQGAIAQHQT